MPRYPLSATRHSGCWLIDSISPRQSRGQGSARGSSHLRPHAPSTWDLQLQAGAGPCRHSLNSLNPCNGSIDDSRCFAVAHLHRCTVVSDPTRPWYLIAPIPCYELHLLPPIGLPPPSWKQLNCHELMTCIETFQLHQGRYSSPRPLLVPVARAFGWLCVFQARMNLTCPIADTPIVSRTGSGPSDASSLKRHRQACHNAHLVVP